MITYLKGDATDPKVDGPKIIAHVCNNKGGWGRGFVLALSVRWEEPEEAYRAWSRSGIRLGNIQTVEVGEGVWVVNMAAQNGYASRGNPVPLDYRALEDCLSQVNSVAVSMGASVHMPRIGCGLAGGKWGEVEKIIFRTLPEVPVYVYDL